MCAWRCSATSNTGLVNNLVAAKIITSSRVKEAMLAVDRHLFIPSTPTASAYSDAPQSIGHGATISAPHMHAYALEMLNDYLTPGAHVLDIGAGSGYLTACMAHMVGPNGLVVGVEHIPELVQSMKSHLTQWDPHCLTSRRIVCIAEDGRLGIPSYAPYRAIHVGAAASVIPSNLIDQLDSPGRLIIPVGHEFGNQQLMQVTKDQFGHVTKSQLMGVRYVPLTDRQRQVSH